MATTPYGTIQTFLQSANPKSKTIQKALDLTERLTELLWTALSAIQNSELEAVGFTKMAKKQLGNQASFYVSELRRRGMIKKGSRRGNWMITDKAIKKITATSSGERASSEEATTKKPSVKAKRKYTRRAPTVKTKKVAKKTTRKYTRRVSGPKSGVAINVGEMTISQIHAELVRCDGVIQEAEQKKAAIKGQLQAQLKTWGSIKNLLGK